MLRWLRGLKSRPVSSQREATPRAYINLFHIGQDHPLSNFLAEAVTTQSLFLGKGHADLREVPEVLNTLTTEQLTQFGSEMRKVVSGKKFVDLACGDPNRSRIPAIVAKAFGAREYIGVDQNLPDGPWPSEGLRSRNFPVDYKREDVLHFLRGLQRQRGVVFYISAFDPFEKDDEATKVYINDCLKEMQKVTKKGDAIIIGMGTRGFHPDNFGFSLRTTAIKASPEGEFPLEVMFVRN